MSRFALICVSYTAIALSTFANAQICQSTIVSSAPDSRYQVVANTQGAEILDLETRLIWQRCSVGQSWSGTQCQGEAQLLDWSGALKQVAIANAGKTSTQSVLAWRVPNIRELHSLVEDACLDSSINYNIFPNTPPQLYWSSSPSATKPTQAWYLDFSQGFFREAAKSQTYSIRLVRTAP